ncbi:MAG TPA: GNAT family N-acetyltransferase [Actinomycetales bacterium]|nr:GNAT family N-acetyltransferase [Actinomycetales bacterium]
MARAAVDVRVAGPDDAALLLVLAASARAEHGSARPDSAPHRDRLAAALRRADVEVLVAEVGQEPVGLLVLRSGELVPLSGTPAAHVEQLYVHPDWRRRGAARQLLLVAATRGEQLGFGDVVCTVPPSGRDAHRFLARLGFVPLVSQRVVPVASLVRRLTGDRAVGRRRTGVEQLLARRRREQQDRRAAVPRDGGRRPVGTVPGRP